MTDPPLAGRVALVTGASRGIGGAVAERLRASGAQVARMARSLTTGTAHGFYDCRCDVADPVQVDATIEEVVTRLGAPDIVVNNAGIFAVQPVEEWTPPEFAEQLRVNLNAPFFVLRAVVPHLKQRRSGHVVTIGSVADRQPFPGNAAYGASKYGLRGLHEVVALELRPAGIRCSLISPGATDTGLWDAINPDERPGFLPRRDMLSPHDVADAVLFAVTRPARANVDVLYLGTTA